MKSKLRLESELRGKGRQVGRGQSKTMKACKILEYQKIKVRSCMVRDIPGDLRICLPMQGMWVQSLVRELRSHMRQNNQGPVLQLLSLRAAMKHRTCCGQHCQVSK